MEISCRPTKWYKGQRLLQLIDSYVVVDIETTGFSAFYSEIIELSAIKVKDNQIIDKFTTLCKPKNKIDSFITELTGITNEMLNAAPSIKDVIKEYISFIGNFTVVGHNISFDINFIYYNYYNLCDKYFSNDYIDTLMLARKALPELEHHRLRDLVEYYQLHYNNLHRGLEDCKATFDIYSILKRSIIENNISLNDDISLKPKTKKKLDLKSITANTDDIDIYNPFYKKHCVFTGTLKKMTREEAAQIVANLGGFSQNTVTAKTNFLIIGNYEMENYNYRFTIKDGKSTKHKKAEQLILKGSDLQIITENIFYDMIENEE